MTPEELASTESDIRQFAFHEDELLNLVAEVRSLWAERDARLLVGRPVSEERLDWIRVQGAADLARYGAKKLEQAENTPYAQVYHLLQHVAFLERLLADADDLPQVRRTGYADGWRAAMSKAKEMAKEVAWPEDVKGLERYLEELIERGPE